MQYFTPKQNLMYNFEAVGDESNQFGATSKFLPPQLQLQILFGNHEKSPVCRNCVNTLILKLYKTGCNSAKLLTSHHNIKISFWSFFVFMLTLQHPSHTAFLEKSFRIFLSMGHFFTVSTQFLFGWTIEDHQACFAAAVGST